ncbi:hypothetical protein SBDP2_1460001 [Syntrophobacter sp. SbD2]|nr:hypothetical protein SBDP2_1460001 [Syntrophobacter sp. SbD2]
MADISGRYVITYNGEIYNYIEIYNELKTLSAMFRSDSDTEVILEAYKVWGEKCLEWFKGRCRRTEAFLRQGPLRRKAFPPG